MVVCFCGRNDVDDVFGDYIPIDIPIYRHTYVYNLYLHLGSFAQVNDMKTHADVWRSLEYAQSYEN